MTRVALALVLAAGLGLAACLAPGLGLASPIGADGSHHSAAQGLGCSVVLDRCVARAGQIEIGRSYAPDATWQIAVLNEAVAGATLIFEPETPSAAAPLAFPPDAWSRQGGGRAVLTNPAKATALLARLAAQGDRRSGLTVILPGRSRGTIVDMPTLRADLAWIDRQQGRSDTNRTVGPPPAPGSSTEALDAIAQRLAEPNAGLAAMPPQVLAAHRRLAPDCWRAIPAIGRRDAPPADVTVNHGLWLGNGDALFVVFCRRSDGVSASRLYLAKGEALDRITPLRVPVWNPQARRFAPTLDLPGDVDAWSSLQQISHRWNVGRCSLVQTTRILRGEAVVVAVAGSDCLTLDGSRRIDRMTEEEIFRAPPEHR
ncbi:hypothetical protein [Phreatobacter stygius]|uniref:DUF1176 domain-containing protein n=1 Tax=Phreatobacter stygius TaxID=1940610 RepID=A0A4D7AVL0_9HYPH|nr:hypothetical protein [Phreatobacter stygius]QCI63811.1 hypothetical protein E8M01_05865 [Phreatobacter stygius]